MDRQQIGDLEGPKIGVASDQSGATLDRQGGVNPPHLDLHM